MKRGTRKAGRMINVVEFVFPPPGAATLAVAAAPALVDAARARLPAGGHVAALALALGRAVAIDGADLGAALALCLLGYDEVGHRGR